MNIKTLYTAALLSLPSCTTNNYHGSNVNNGTHFGDVGAPVHNCVNLLPVSSGAVIGAGFNSYYGAPAAISAPEQKRLNVIECEGIGYGR